MYTLIYCTTRNPLGSTRAEHFKTLSDAFAFIRSRPRTFAHASAGFSVYADVPDGEIPPLMADYVAVPTGILAPATCPICGAALQDFGHFFACPNRRYYPSVCQCHYSVRK